MKRKGIHAGSCDDPREIGHLGSDAYFSPTSVFFNLWATNSAVFAWATELGIQTSADRYSVGTRCVQQQDSH